MLFSDSCTNILIFDMSFVEHPLLYTHLIFVDTRVLSQRNVVNSNIVKLALELRQFSRPFLLLKSKCYSLINKTMCDNCAQNMPHKIAKKKRLTQIIKSRISKFTIHSAPVTPNKYNITTH